MVDISTQANLDALRQAPQDVYTPTGQVSFAATRVSDNVLDLAGDDAFGYFPNAGGILTVNGQNFIYDGANVVGGNSRFTFAAGIVLPAAPLDDITVDDGRIRFTNIPSTGRGATLPTAAGTIGEFFTLTDIDGANGPGRYERTANAGTAADWTLRPITFRNGSTVYAQRFVSADTDTDVDVGTGSTVFMANTSTGVGAANSASGGSYRGGGQNPATEEDTVFFAGGVLRGNNSTFVFTGDAGGLGLNQQEWPGFQAIDDGYRMIIPNCTFRANADLNAAETVMVVHLNGMVNTPGNDFSGVTFQNGQLIAPWNAVEWIRVTFSPDSAADGASVAALTHRRFALFDRGLANDFDGLWYGEFGCDYTGFTNQAIPCAWSNSPARAGTDLTAQGRLDWYLVDGDYSDAYRTNGFQATNDGHGGRAVTLPTRLISARSWNPQFRDRDTNTTLVTDAVIDIGDNQEYFFPQAATNFETALTHVTATTDATRYLEWYPAGTRRNGIVQVDASADSPTGGDTGDQYDLQVRRDRTDPRNYNIWSYTHQNFNADRSVMSPLAQAGFWASSMVLDESAERLQNIDLVSDAAARNNISLADATTLNTLTGMNLFEQAYAMGKQLTYSTRATTTPMQVNGTVLDLGTNDLVLLGDNDSSLAGGNLNLRSTADVAGSELIDEVIYGNLSSNLAKTISVVTLTGSGLTNLTNITVGQGVTFNGGRVRGFTTNAANTRVNLPTTTINGGVTVDINSVAEVDFSNVNFSGASATNQITISRQQVDGTALAAQTVRVLGVPAAFQGSFAAGAGVTGPLEFPQATRINLPAVAGNFAVYNTATDTFIAQGATRNEATSVTFSSDDYTAITDVNVYWAADGYLDITRQLANANDVTLNAIEDPNKATDALPAGTSLTTSRTDGVVTVTGVTNATTFSPTSTNVYWSQLKDEADYVDAMAVSEVIEPALRLVATNRININEAVIQFASGSTPQRQEIMTNVDTRGGGALSASINLNAAQAAIGQEDAYTSTQARVDYAAAGLVTMPDVQTTIDNVGRLSADRLLGIRPGRHDGQ